VTQIFHSGQPSQISCHIYVIIAVNWCPFNVFFMLCTCGTLISMTDYTYIIVDNDIPSSKDPFDNFTAIYVCKLNFK
jgi:hypothetical protein